MIIILIIAFLAMIATYLIPAGQYESIEVNGRTAIDANSFSYIEQTPVSPWNALLALPQGLFKAG